MTAAHSGNTARVSILIPNYNNGRASSTTGDRDLIGDLLVSLESTLKDEATPFEILAYDDGSTDDSLQTLRDWSQKKWPNNTPFLELIEADHCGVLAKTANVLSRKAKGDILVRLDGDIECLTPNWVSILCRIFDQAPPRVGVIGPKQLRSDMQIHAFGDWVLHPNGYTHVAGGFDRYAMRYPLEVDHVMGCFYCCRKAVFEELGGYDENFLRGQTVDFGLRARQNGWRCFAVPDIEFVHHHGMRQTRKSKADTSEGVVKSLDTFEKKWGFNRIAPDLDQVRKRYAGSPLLWNPRWFASDQPQLALPPIPSPNQIDSTEWSRYAKDADFRRTIDLRLAVVGDIIRQTGKPRQALLMGSRLGLIAHMLALQGIQLTCVEPTAEHAAFARACTHDRDYPAGAPTFVHQASASQIPLDDRCVDLALVFDQLEVNPNPVGLLKELHRVIEPEKILALTSYRKLNREEAVNDPEHRYRWPELLTQVQVGSDFAVTIDPAADDPTRDMILIARSRAKSTTGQVPESKKQKSTPEPAKAIQPALT